MQYGRWKEYFSFSVSTAQATDKGKISEQVRKKVSLLTPNQIPALILDSRSDEDKAQSDVGTEHEQDYDEDVLGVSQLQPECPPSTVHVRAKIHPALPEQ
jgi:hypothetical protein